MFMGRCDSYLLRHNVEGRSGFDAIGSDHERGHLVLEDLMSYDEIALSALMSCGGPTQVRGGAERGVRGDGVYERRPGDKGSGLCK